MREMYSDDITNPSLRELGILAEWYNEKIGNHPVIVGGWAVYCYSKGLGSKDIDVVFPSDVGKNETLLAYFLSHGYSRRKRNFFDEEFVKVLPAGKTRLEIIVDAVSASRVIVIPNTNVRIPWKWAINHSREHRVEKATIIYLTSSHCLPTRLVLLLAEAWR